MRTNNQGYMSLVYERYTNIHVGVGDAQARKGGLKYWLHRFQPLLPCVKHGDIWR